jgi:hypothetical protein
VGQKSVAHNVWHYMISGAHTKLQEAVAAHSSSVYGLQLSLVVSDTVFERPLAAAVCGNFEVS